MHTSRTPVTRLMILPILCCAFAQAQTAQPQLELIPQQDGPVPQRTVTRKATSPSPASHSPAVPHDALGREIVTTIRPRAMDSTDTATDTTLQNVIFGAYNAIPTGDLDTVIGVRAGQSLTTAREMTIIGSNACRDFASTSPTDPAGIENGLTTCIGSQAGAAWTNGLDNIFIGQKALENATFSAGTVAIGNHAITAAMSSIGDTVVGGFIGNPLSNPVDSWQGNTMVGEGIAIGSGNKIDNTLIGGYSAEKLTTGQENSTLGAYAARNMTTGSYNIAIGAEVAPGLVDGVENIIIGPSAGPAVDSKEIVVIGSLAASKLQLAQGLTVVGTRALLQSAQAVDTTVVGFNAAGFQASNLNQVTAIGSSAGAGLTNASNDTLMGYQAGAVITTGSQNVMLGDRTGGNLSSGSGNVAIGNGAGNTWQGNETNNVVIGNYASTAPGVSNAVQLGNGSNNSSNSLQWGNRILVDANSDTIISTNQPVSSTSQCNVGAFRTAGGSIYLCVSTNHWMRAALQDF